MKILVDALGGDLAPNAVLDGIAQAYQEDPTLELVVVGPEATCKDYLTKKKVDVSRFEFLDAKEAVLNTDHPAMFFRTKPESSLAVAYEALRKRDDLGALVSAGPTGAVLSGGVLRLGRMEGIERPALLATLPAKNHSVVRLIDSGANMDCKPEYLLQFAIMASAYLRCIGMENPSVKLLNVGSEEGKGDERSKAAYALLKDSGLNFQGNVEGDHVLDGNCDIVVTDGFAGNVFLKGTEEAFYFMKDLMSNAMGGTPLRKMGAVFQLKGIKEAKEPFEFAKKACAPLLGTKKLVMKCHGKSEGFVFAGTIHETKTLLDKNLLAEIASSLPKKKEA